jgi:hypothetical protein
MRALGYRHLNAFSPFPVEGIGAILGAGGAGVGRCALAGGIIGAVFAIGVQYGVNYDYALEVGGKPLYALSAFFVLGVAFAVLGATLGAFGSMLVLNGLPRLHHPLFDAPRFGAASDDGFFLSVAVSDPHFEEPRTRRDLVGVGAISVASVP